METADRMAQLQTEYRFTFVAKGPELVKSVVEMVVNTVIEWKVIRYVELVPEDVCLKLLYFLQSKERDAKLIFLIFFLRKRLRFLFYRPYESQYFDGFAFEGNTYLFHKFILHGLLEIFKQLIDYFSHILVLIGSCNLITNKVSVDDIGLNQFGVCGQKIVKNFFASEDIWTELYY